MKYPASFARSMGLAILTSRFVPVFVFVTCVYAFTAFAQVPIPIVTPVPSPTPAPPVMSREMNSKGAPHDYIYMRANGAAHFTAEATRLGQRGYRMMHISLGSHSAMIVKGEGAERYRHLPLAAIFKRDPGNTYEYDWFEAELPGEIVTRITARAQNGFYYRGDVGAFDDSQCGNPSGADPNDSFAMTLETIAGIICWSQGGVYFVERKNGEKIKYDYRVHVGRFGWGKSPTAELEASIANTAQMGFRPVSMGKMKEGISYAFYTIVEKLKDGPETPIKEQYKFMKSEFKFSKRVNAAAKEGYRIKYSDMFGAHENALLEKDDDTTPTAYIWADAAGKTHDKEMADAYNAGSRFSLVNRESQDLILEVTPGEKYEYKLLLMNSVQIKATKKNPNPPPAKTMDEIFAEFDALLNDGYIIRDILYAGGPRILFERKK